MRWPNWTPEPDFLIQCGKLPVMAATDHDLPDDLNEISTLDGDLRIGEFLVRPLLKQVIRLSYDGTVKEEHSLPDKSMGVLIYLAENARQVCSRDDILDAVWGEDREAYDRVLDNAVAEIRRVFGDDARKPTYVQTVPKLGYRWLQPLSDPETPRVPAQTGSASHEHTDTRQRSLWVTVTVLLLAFGILATLGFWTLREELDDSSVYVSIRMPETLVNESLISKVDIEAALFNSHPCNEESLLRPRRWFSTPNIEIKLSESQDTEKTAAGARLQWAEEETVEFARTEATKMNPPRPEKPNGDISKVFASDVRLAADRLVCETSGLSTKARACHCRSSAEGPASSTNRPVEIVRRLEMAVELDPNSLQGYSSLAAAYSRMLDRERATAALEAGLRRGASVDSIESLELRRNLATVLQDHEYARELTEKLIELQPDDWRYRLELADLLVDHFDACNESLVILESLESERPDTTSISIAKAKALARCSMWQDATELLQDSLERSPREMQLLRVIVPVLEFRGKLREAEHYAKRLLALSPSDAGSYWYVGGLAVSRGRYSEAERWLNLARSHNPWPIDEGYIYRFEAQMAEQLNDFPTCVEKVRRASALQWRVLLGLQMKEVICLLGAGEVAEAIEVSADLKQRCKDPARKSDSWRASLVSAAVALNDKPTSQAIVDQALEDLHVGVRTSGGDHNAAYYAATTIFKYNESAARYFLEKAVELNPGTPWVNCKLGLLYRHQGLPAEGAAHMSKAIEIFGNPPEDPLGMECAEALAELDPTFTVAN